MFSVLRTRSLATSQRSQSVKKHRVTESLHINVAQADDDVMALEDSGRLRTYFSCFRILGLGWAVAVALMSHLEASRLSFVTGSKSAPISAIWKKRLGLP